MNARWGSGSEAGKLGVIEISRRSRPDSDILGEGLESDRLVLSTSCSLPRRTHDQSVLLLPKGREERSPPGLRGGCGRCRTAGPRLAVVADRVQ
jgi:hypothetical protein